MIYSKYSIKSLSNVYYYEGSNNSLSKSFSINSLFPKNILVLVLPFEARVYEEIIFKSLNKKLVLLNYNSDWILSSFIFDKAIKLYKIVIIFNSDSSHARAYNLALYFHKKLYDESNT